MIKEERKSNDRYCIIGAGPAGLAACRNFREAGIPFDCFERQDDLGGNWYYGSSHSSVYKTTHLISSKRLTEFSDYRMPREYPHYPSHRQVFDYLRSFAEHYELYQHISFESSVEHVRPDGEGNWQVQISNEPEPRSYKGVVVCNGHHWNPRFPSFPGNFTGRVLHSHDYLEPSSMADERVLVVGAGNSGCDIAVDMAGVANSVCLSMRRGYYFLPKFVFGIPLDRCEYNLRHRFVRGWLFRLIAKICLQCSVGPPERYGLPKPDHAMFASHPIVNSKILDAVGHGQVKPVPNISGFEGNTIHFVDGSSREIDTIVYATGYKISFPFLDVRHLGCDENNEDVVPRMALNVFSPAHENLFVCGMIQPNGGVWKLSDYQSQLIARLIVARSQNPEAAEWFEKKMARMRPAKSSSKYVASPRHSVQVEYNTYRERLEKLLKEFDRRGVTGRLEADGEDTVGLLDRVHQRSSNPFLKDRN